MPATPIIIHCNGKAEMLPVYQSIHASGADLKADISEEIVIAPMKRACVPTGLRLMIPSGYEAQVRPRSGLALKNGVTVLNTPGTIDADYRGEVKVILVNLGEEDFTIRPGDRIAQIVFAKVERAEFNLMDGDVEATSRGSGGFGSTGV
jgi:dUTP pyrophosphatase